MRNNNRQTVIRVDDVYKDFRLPHEKVNSVKSLFVNPFRRRKSVETQHALRGVSFEVEQGEFLGIIGRNGCGKSTLLKMIAGIYQPTKGSITVNGEISPFLELGVGFNPELTGRENVFLNGALLGFNKKEIQAKYEQIVEFAELKDFMDQKLMNYSSGMQVRLAFSVAIHAQSEILLIDEVLAVGDENFQKKCFEVFQRFKREGKTIVFVSHSMANIKDFCDRVVLIDNGKIVMCGEPDPVINKYHGLNTLGDETDSFQASDVKKRYGSGFVKVQNLKIINHEGEATKNLEWGKKFKVKFEVKFFKDIKSPAYAVTFRKNPQENLFGANSFYGTKPLGAKKGETISVEAKGIMPLAAGAYYLSVAVADQPLMSHYEDLDILDNYLIINVTSDQVFCGPVGSEMYIEVTAKS